MAKQETAHPLTVTPGKGADYLGISRKKMMDLLKEGAIRSVRVGTRWLVPITEIHRWLDSGLANGSEK